MALEKLELMPEPEDSRILTAVDSEAPGYSGADYGLTDQEARELRWPLGPMKNCLQSRQNRVEYTYQNGAPGLREPDLVKYHITKASNTMSTKPRTVVGVVSSTGGVFRVYRLFISSGCSMNS